MLPSFMTDIAVAVRISGRRMRSQGTNPASLRPRRTASPRRKIHTLTPETPSLDSLFINALVRAGLCREHACAFHCWPGKPQKRNFHIRRRVSRSYSDMAAQVRAGGDQEEEELSIEIPPIEVLGTFENQGEPPQVEEKQSVLRSVGDILTTAGSNTTVSITDSSSQQTQSSAPTSNTYLVPAISIRQKIIVHQTPLPSIVKGRHVFYPSPDSEKETTPFQVRKAPFRDSNAPTDWESNSKVNQKPKSTATSFRGLRSSLLKIVPSTKRKPNTALNPPIPYSSTSEASDTQSDLPRIHRYVERIGPKRVMSAEYQQALQTFVDQPTQKEGEGLGFKSFKPFNKRNPLLNTVNKMMFGRPPQSEEDITVIETFRKTLWSYKFDNKELFDLYLTLPGRRIEYLDRKTMDRTIAAFMSVPLRDETAMLRYMTILEDMHASGIPLTRPEWNQAMSMVAFAYRHVTKVEVDMVLDMWTNMEENYGILANIDTFNILLDIASKAKNHDLFHRLLGEIRERKLEWDRFTHTIIITHCGVMGDAAEVSRAYKKMVDAGEIIDTTVLNAVMTAMLACDEFSAAERVYEHMRQLSLYDPDPPSQTPLSPLLGWITRHRAAHDYEIARDQAKKLRHMSRLVEYSNMTKASLKPDIITYHILIFYFCKVGNWDGLRHTVGHMNDAGIPANSTTYEAIFRGFWVHGQDDSPIWRAEVLQRLLDELLYQVGDEIKWSGALVRKLVSAVANVTRDSETTKHYWTESVKAWERQGGRVDHMTIARYNQIMHDFDSKSGSVKSARPNGEDKVVLPGAVDVLSDHASDFRDRRRTLRERQEDKERKLREKEWKARMLMERGRIEAERQEWGAMEAEKRERMEEESRARREQEGRDRQAWLLAEKRVRERREQQQEEREARERLEKVMLEQEMERQEQDQKMREAHEQQERERQERERQEREWQEREIAELVEEQRNQELVRRNTYNEGAGGKHFKSQEEVRITRAWGRDTRNQELQHAWEQTEEDFYEQQTRTRQSTLPPLSPISAQFEKALRQRREQAEAAKKRAAEEVQTKLATLPPEDRETEARALKAADQERQRKLMRMVFLRQSKIRTLH